MSLKVTRSELFFKSKLANQIHHKTTLQLDIPGLFLKFIRCIHNKLTFLNLPMHFL